MTRIRLHDLVVLTFFVRTIDRELFGRVTEGLHFMLTRTPRRRKNERNYQLHAYPDFAPSRKMREAAAARI